MKFEALITLIRIFVCAEKRTIQTMESEKEGEIVYGSESDSEAASQLMMRRRHGTDDDEDDEPSDVVTLLEAQRGSIGSQRDEPRRKNPTSNLIRGKYCIHDDRGGEQRWYRSGKSSAPEDDGKWKHDKFEELQQGWVPKNRCQGHYKHQGTDHGHVRGRGPVRYRPITGTRNAGPTIQENQSPFSSSTPIEKTSKNQLVQIVPPKNKNAEVSSSTGPERRFWPNPSKKNASPASQMSYPINHQPKNVIRSSMFSRMSNSPSASGVVGHSHNHPSTAGDSHPARQFSSLSPTSEGSSHKHVHGKNPAARKGFRGPPPQ